MDALTAHALLAQWDDRSALDGIHPSLAHVPLWPALATGAAVCSGRLEDCQTDEDLRDAVAHGASLVSAGIVPFDDVKRAGCQVINAVMDYGEQQEREHKSMGGQ